MFNLETILPLITVETQFSKRSGQTFNIEVISDTDSDLIWDIDIDVHGGVNCDKMYR